jgi:methylthioribulose-1-phosphate dehydratase
MNLPADIDPRKQVAAGRALCRCVHELNAQGWCQGTGGNFSVTLVLDPFRLLITQSGRNKRHLDIPDLMVVGPGGKPLEGQPGKPSAEALLHYAIIRLTGAGSVLHTHSVWNTLLGEHFRDSGGLTITGYEMLKGLEGVSTHEAHVRVPILPNSQDMNYLSILLENLLTGQPGLHGVLIAGHGLYTWGDSVEQAQRHVEIFEFLFELVGRRTPFAPFEG